jgi:hypothetical protein
VLDQFCASEREAKLTEIFSESLWLKATAVPCNKDARTQALLRRQKVRYRDRVGLVCVVSVGWGDVGARVNVTARRPASFVLAMDLKHRGGTPRRAYLCDR